MQLTVELDVDQIATLAYLAEILELSRSNDAARMRAEYPLDVINAVRHLIDGFEIMLSGMDSPYEVSVEVSQNASSLAHRMIEVSEHILEMKTEFDEKRAGK